MLRKNQALDPSKNLPGFAVVDRSELAAKLRTLKVEIAQAMIDLFYRRHPVWRALFGEEALTSAREQVVLHVEMLAAAIDVGLPETFARYARWLVRVLQARGIAARPVSEPRFALRAKLCGPAILLKRFTSNFFNMPFTRRESYGRPIALALPKSTMPLQWFSTRWLKCTPSLLLGAGVEVRVEDAPSCPA
jgi:hypothetical protein